MTKLVMAMMWLYYICVELPCWVVRGCKPRPGSRLMWKMAYWVVEREERKQQSSCQEED